MPALENVFETTHTERQQLSYLLYLPKDYQEQLGKEWPLILFLHGAGERGDDLDLLQLAGLPQLVAQQANYPFILAAPQCPADTWWVHYIDTLAALTDSLQQRYRVDKSRCYLSGLSMGGAGTWLLAAKYPQCFAAIAPICGASLWWYGFPERAAALQDTPIWTFHGDADDVVPIRVTDEIVTVLQREGADVRFTRYPGVGHDSWTQTYQYPALYEWLFSHKR